MQLIKVKEKIIITIKNIFKSRFTIKPSIDLNNKIKLNKKNEMNK